MKGIYFIKRGEFEVKQAYFETMEKKVLRELESDGKKSPVNGYSYLRPTMRNICYLGPGKLISEDAVFEGCQNSKYTVTCKSLRGELFFVRLRHFKREIRKDR